MLTRITGTLCVILLFAMTPLPTCAAVGDGAILRVGTVHSPPFINKRADGSYDGISIQLWKEVADELDFSYEMEERSVEKIIEDLQAGRLDIAVAALTITEDREIQFDFTHPIYTTSLAVAVRKIDQPPVALALLSRLFSLQFLQIVFALIALLYLVGWLVWLLEHKQNPEKDSHTINKVSEGFWWAAATMTTVGYGDKTPLTQWGRVFGVTWMFTALMLVASFIAAFSSILTIDQLNRTDKEALDLWKMKVATITASTSELYLVKNGVPFSSYGSVREGLESLVDGEVDAMVYDAPLLDYLIKREFSGRIEVLPHALERQDYGFALPSGSQLREPVNRVLLAKIRDPLWASRLEHYLK